MKHKFSKYYLMKPSFNLLVAQPISSRRRGFAGLGKYSLMSCQGSIYLEVSPKKLQIITVLLPNSVYSGLQNSCHECGGEKKGVANFCAELAKPKSV